MPGNSSDAVIFKILSGLQAGVEVTLVPGDYTLGNDPNDDLQLIDVSISPQHAKLRISSGSIALAGLKGALRSASGSTLEPDGIFQEIEPLDVITAGTTRFALGYPSSQWSTVIEDKGGVEAAAAPQSTGIAWRDRWRLLAVPFATLLLVVGVLLWLASSTGLVPFGARIRGEGEDLAVTRAALDRFPFGRAVVLRQDVDGTIYVTGYVDTPVERRALLGAIEKTGIPARVRLWVRQTIRSEVASLIAAEKVPVAFHLSDVGVLTLEGVILNEARAARFIDLVKERILGLSGVESKIRTAASLLVEIERLAEAAQIRSFVLLHINADLVEATGAIPAEKIDAFVGFLQSYARRFAREIPLRSFVQLQGATTAGIDRPILVGGIPNGTDLHLDPDQMAEATDAADAILRGRKTDDRQGSTRTVTDGTNPQALSPLSIGRSGSASAAGTGSTERGASAADASSALDADRNPRGSDGREPDGNARRPNLSFAPDGNEARLRGRATEGSAPEPDSSNRAAASDKTDGAARGEGDRGTEGLQGRLDRTPALGRADAGSRSRGSNEADVKRGRPDPTSVLAMPGADPRGSKPETGGAAKRVPVPSVQDFSNPIVTDGAGPAARTADGFLDSHPNPVRRAEPTPSVLRSAAEDLLRRWQAGVLDRDSRDRALKKALEDLGSVYPPQKAGESLQNRYLPAQVRASDDGACSGGPANRWNDVAASLLWLDLLSVSEAASLADQTPDRQLALLEVALSPERAAACARRLPEGERIVTRSVYLQEIARNPAFIRYIVRTLAPYALDLTGADLTPPRSILTRGDRRLREGASVDDVSRVASIGELGVAIQLKASVAAFVFGPDLTWKITP